MILYFLAGLAPFVVYNAAAVILHLRRQRRLDAECWQQIESTLRTAP